MSMSRLLVPVCVCAGEGQTSSAAAADVQQAKSLKCDE